MFLGLQFNHSLHHIFDTLHKFQHCDVTVSIQVLVYHPQAVDVVLIQDLEVLAGRGRVCLVEALSK